MFKRLLQEIQSIQDDVRGVKNDVQGVKDEIQGVKDDVQGIKGEIQVVKKDLCQMKSQLHENTELTKAIHHRQEETDAKVKNLAMDVHKLRGELTSLKEGQARQDKILESLALRSLEQETDLRDLKRIK